MRLSTRPSLAAAGLLAILSITALGATRALVMDASAATTLRVNVGGGQTGISVEQFLPNHVSVHVGDSVQFINPYEEIHTVTFLAGGEAPPLVVPAPGAPAAGGPPKLIFNPQAAFATPATDFEGSVYANSGILNKGQSWTLTFTKTGLFSFRCLVHPGMEGTVNVSAPGGAFTTQEEANQQAASMLAAGIAAGETAAAKVTAGKSLNSDGTTTWEVLNAPSAGTSDVMRFIPARLQVGAGDTVVWKNDTPVPHTVTFTSGAAIPEIVLPEPQPAGPPNLVLNPQVLFPAGSGSYGGTGYVNSGFLGTGPESTAGRSFALRFTNAGVYSYICLLHADQGMAGVIEVKGAALAAPSTGDAGLAANEEGSLAPALVAGIAVCLAVLAIGRSLARARHRHRAP